MTEIVEPQVPVVEPTVPVQEPQGAQTVPAPQGAQTQPAVPQQVAQPVVPQPVQQPVTPTVQPAQQGAQTPPSGQITYDEHGVAYIDGHRYYNQQSVDDLLGVQQNKNKRLDFLNKAIIAGVEPTLAQTLSASLEIDKLAEFDYSSIVQNQSTPVKQPVQAGSVTPQATPAGVPEPQTKSILDYARESVKK